MPGNPPFKQHDEHLDQGDIFANVPFLKWKDGEPTLGRGSRGIVTSHGCSCEDYERQIDAGRTQQAAKMMLRVAPLVPAADMPAHRLEEIRSGEHLDWFYVFGEDGILPDHVVPMAREQPIPAALLTGCAKVSRLADWQWHRLLIHIAVSRFHQKPETLFRRDLLAKGSDPDVP